MTMSLVCRCSFKNCSICSASPLYLVDFRYFGDMKIEEFVGEEVREAFAKYVINEESELPSFMQQQIKDIQLNRTLRPLKTRPR